MYLKRLNQILSILNKTLSIVYTILSILVILGYIPQAPDPISLAMAMFQILMCLQTSNS